MATSEGIGKMSSESGSESELWGGSWKGDVGGVK